MSAARADSSDPVRSLIVATDFSETAGLALARARDIALEHGARLVLAHVLTFQPTAMGAPNPVVLPPDFGSQLRAATRAKLETLAESLRADGLEVQVELSAGIPGRALVDLADEGGADGIVLGTRGLSGFKHLLLGSTAEQVVRRARCPVLTVHPADAEGSGEIRTLVVPTELSGDPTPALDAVVRLFPGRSAAARVLLVYSDHLPSYLQPLLEDLGIDRVGFDEIAGSLGERLRPTADRLARAGFAVETIVREGDPATVITEIAAAESADLIAMETRGRSGLAHLVLGSTAERVVQHASCPVLTVHRDPGSSKD